MKNNFKLNKHNKAKLNQFVIKNKHLLKSKLINCFASISFVFCFIMLGTFLNEPIKNFYNALTPFNCYASTNTEDNNKETYLVYNENNQVIFENNYVEVGDKIIDTNLNEYEIYKVDKNTFKAYAELNGWYEKPSIKKESDNLYFSNNSIKKSVGIYMTHNDESFVPTDNTSSVYGKGGIHDVAKALTNEFKALNYDVYFDETLHLPHDSGAYTRSSVTAKKLLENNVNALFDIHRDGVARSVYVKNVDGIERCKVRIVVGQANPNKEANLQFAMYLVSVAKEYCPWLFLDIYNAKGHYNQALTSKGLLFEMGTYLAEKELVIDSVKYLASVIDKTLFSTVVENNNTLTIVDQPNLAQQDNLVNNVLNQVTPTSQPFKSKYLVNVIIFASVIVVTFISLTTLAIIKHKKRLKLINIKNTHLISENTQKTNNKQLNKKQTKNKLNKKLRRK